MGFYDTVFSAFVTLLVTIDPPGLAPLFLALTPGMDRNHRGQVALRASIIGFIVMALFAIAGAQILGMFGISIGAFRVAGGLLLFWIAFEMILRNGPSVRKRVPRWPSPRTISAISPPSRSLFH